MKKIQMKLIGFYIQTSLILFLSYSCKEKDKNDVVLLPEVATTQLTVFNSSSVECGGIVVDDKGIAIIERGICYGFKEVPTIEDSVIVALNTETFTCIIHGLSPKTNYFVRAYAINSEGISYGKVKSFTTLSVPNVYTNEISDILINSVKCGGRVVSDGGISITQRGICWSTKENPTISDYKTSEGLGNLEFTSSITGLTGGVKYYVRAYATNTEGTGYGETKVCTTLNITITLNNTTNVLINTAVSGGVITNDLSLGITECGLCWSTNANPSITDKKTIDSYISGSFSSKMTGLAANTKYYVRAYAKNSAGISYTDVKEFTTSLATITDISNNTYKVIQIGDQIWMAENLRVLKFSNGSTINEAPPAVSAMDVWQTIAVTEQYYDYYNDNSSTAISYGVLYTWAAARNLSAGISQNQGVCPVGWHLPSNADWNTLVDDLGGSASAGGSMKATNSFWTIPNAGATNTSGFTAIPVGYRKFITFYEHANGSYWWSLEESSSDNGYCWGIMYNSAAISNLYLTKKAMMPVRCIKN